MFNRFLICNLVSMFGLQTTQAVEISKDLSLNITTTAMTSYHRSGLDLTDSKPALQGLFTLAHKSGFDFSTQITNYDVDVAAKYELAYTVGYYQSITEKVWAYSSIGQTIFPNTASLNVTEWYLTADAYGAYFKYYYDWGKSSNAQYRYIGYKHNFPKDVWIDLRQGYNNLGTLLINENGEQRKNYSVRRVELGKKYKDINYSLTYWDTDLTKRECISIMGFEEKCSQQIVFSVSKTF